MTEPLICNVCGYPAHLVTGTDRYSHSLPEGRKYWQQKLEFPECWGDAKVTIEVTKMTERCGTSKTPKGWYCTRDLGHAGPCAVIPQQPWYKRLGAAIGTAIGEAKFGS